MIGNSENRISFNGNGSATEFSYQFKILNKTDIKVLLVDNKGKETLLNKDYYVDTEKSVVHYPGYAPGAEIPEAQRPPVLQNGWKLILYREVPVTQESRLDEYWPFNVIESMADKLTIICQQLLDGVSRSIKISEGSKSGIDTVIDVAPNKGLKWNAEGTKIVATVDPADVLPQANDVLKQTEAARDKAIQKADAAAESALSAADSERNADTAMNKARAWAEGHEPGGASTKSSKEWATEASTKATEATEQAQLAKWWAQGHMPENNPSNQSAKEWAKASEIRANIATEKAELATQKATESLASANKAKENADAAKTSAAAAKASETKAKASETNASNSANTATTKASEASTSAAAAKASETKAMASADRADTAAQQTTQAVMDAERAAELATSKALEAFNSANTATTKASEASASAAAAKSSETNAGTAATKATTEANRAKTEADRAKTAADSVGNPVVNVTSSGGTLTVIKGDGSSSNLTVTPPVATQTEATDGTDNTKIMTPLRVKQSILKNAPKQDLSPYAKLASPAFTGTPTAPTASKTTNNTQLATTAFVQALVGAVNNGGIVAQSLGQNGFVKFANGLILQWGFVGKGSGYNQSTFTYPLSLNNVFCVLTTGQNDAITDKGANYYYGCTNTGVSVVTHMKGYIIVLGA